MKAIGRALLWVLKGLCYAALIFVVAGIGSLILVSLLDVCPRLNEGGVSCVSQTWEDLAKFGMTVMLLTVFTGVPALLAILGLIFGIRDWRAWRRGRKTGAT